GKLLLAFRDPWREVVLASPLAPVTARTLVDPGVLRADLGAARERGFAREDGEFRPGLHALAVPVRDAAGEVEAALALSSRSGELDALLEPLAAAGAELSARLGAA